jgi:hypothetical protein
MVIGLFVTSLDKDYNKSPASYWIRILQMMDYYKKQGAEVHLNNYFLKYDVCIVFRKPKAKYYYIMRYLKLISKTVYFDTCINIFHQHEELDSNRLKYAHKIGMIADGLICASHQIAEYARPHVKSVHVMEDPLDVSHFNLIKQDINFAEPVFGWAGVGPKSLYLNKFADRISGNIIIISDPKIKNTVLHFNYTHIPWNFKNFPADLLRCDIALLPRNYDDPYNDSHSSFKALVFASMGIPVIANAIPSYRELAKYYDGIVFLEDHDNSIEICIKELKGRNLNTDRLKKYYSCENQAANLLRFFNTKIKNK